VSFSDLRNERLLRAGFALGALAAVCAALAGAAALAESPARRAPVAQTARLEVEPIVSALALASLAIIVTAALSSRTWLRPLGVLATTTVATSAGIEVLRGRVADVFAPDIRTTLLAGGLLLSAAFWVAVVAVAVQLVALRQIAQSRPIEPEERLEQVTVAPDGRPLRSPIQGTAGLALGILGLLAPVMSGLAAALSISALGEIRAYDGRLGGRGAAMAGLVLGIAGLSLLIALLGIGQLTFTPGR
jgi:hypothetical protein